MKKVLRTIVIILILFCALAALVICSISPVKKFEQATSDHKSVEQIISPDITAIAETILLDPNKELSFSISEKELNEILETEKVKLLQQGKKIDNIHALIQNGQLVLYIDSSIMSLPTQYIIYTDPQVEAGRIKLKISKIYAGKIYVPVNWALDYADKNINSLIVNKEDKAVSISTDLPHQLVLTDLKVDKKITVKFKISIKSRSDLLQLILHFT